MSKWIRKSDNVFEAEQHSENNLTKGVHYRPDGSTYVTTIQGREVDISPGEWAIQELDGEHYYPCSDEIFRALYDPLED